MAADEVLLSEAGSNLLEFGALGVRSGRPEFLTKAEAAIRRLHRANPDQVRWGSAMVREAGNDSGKARVPDTIRALAFSKPWIPSPTYPPTQLYH